MSVAIQRGWKEEPMTLVIVIHVSHVVLELVLILST